MISLFRPTPELIDAYIARCREQPFTYPEVGASRGAAPPGYVADHRRLLVGLGGQAFAAACECLRRWDMIQLGWVTPCWPHTPVAPGEVVATLAWLAGAWFLNPCRIVYVEQEPRRLRFAYGTVADHAEKGEERFSVEWLDDDTVWYDLYAFSRPGGWLTRIGYPMARLMQKRFGRDSLAAFARAVQGRLAEAPREIAR